MQKNQMKGDREFNYFKFIGKVIGVLGILSVVFTSAPYLFRLWKPRVRERHSHGGCMAYVGDGCTFTAYGKKAHLWATCLYLQDS